MAAFYRYAPRPPLSTFVEFFWLFEGERPPHPKERRLPDGAIDLIFNLHDDQIRIYDRRVPDQYQRYRGSVISGPQSTYTLLDADSLTAVLGVSFKPGGVLPLLPFAASELYDRTLSLATIWGQRVTDLRGRLCAAKTPGARFALLERFLLDRLDLARASYPVVTYAASALWDVPHSPTVASLADHIGLSQTRLVQVFREAMGMTPKQYARLSRFQRVLRLLEAGQCVTWADVVAACGYFDQAHLIHEFQAFAGLAPSAYLALRGQYRNHVPLPA